MCEHDLGACYADEMIWSSEQKAGEKAGAQTEEAAMTAALTRAFRAIDEEVIGSVCSCKDSHHSEIHALINEG